MKSKGAVKFFAIALAVVCLFQLSFTFVGNRIDKKASSYAERFPSEKREAAKRHYLDSISREPVYNIFVRKYNYLEVKEKELNLGLDLRGGMHITLEVAEDQLLKQLSNNNDDPAFRKALEDSKKEQVTSQRNFVDIFASHMLSVKPDAHLADYFATLENKAVLKANSSNNDVVNYLKDQANSALDRTFEVLRTRIDKFGVTQPNIQIDRNEGRIIVELPGVDDPDRVRKLLKSTARLEFYETYSLGEIASYLAEADKTLVAQAEGSKTKTTDSTKTPAGTGLQGIKVDSTGKTALNNPLTGKTTTDTGAKKTGSLGNTAAGNRKDTMPLTSMLFSSGLMNQNSGGYAIIGYVLIRDTAKVMAMLNNPEVRNTFPTDVKWGWSAKPNEVRKDMLELYALKVTGLEGQEAILYGDVIIDAQRDLDRQTNSYVVAMQMNSQGASEWAKITKEASKDPKNKREIAIVLDNAVYSAPTVQNEIPNGNSQITGNFTAAEAGDLANILKAGKLPVELNVVDEAIVGPSLGADAIHKGVLSLLMGLIAIMFFMVVYYNRSGWVADLALLINLFFITGVLTSLGAALTLPGMAGIVLTLAMAVDANVLIYERIREELNLGKNLRLAVAEGFKNALSSILDGNITTLLIGIILMRFGSGPIYGFAVVLVIGILTSLFCAILISRLIFEWLLAKDRKINFGNKVSMKIFHGINYDFVGKRRIAYWFSGITIGIGIISLFVNGLNYGVDFTGGRTYIVNFEKTVNGDQVRQILLKPLHGNPEVKTYGADNRLSITTDYLSNDEKADSAVRHTITSSLAQNMPDNKTEIVSSQRVTSTVASDVKNSAFLSIIFGLIVVFLYIVLRFKRWQFALGATLALAHDVFFVLTFFSIFKDYLPFSDVDQAVVAALLTVVGYSINDTVVVFDRIREYLRNNRKSPMIPTVNTAINTTLNRTIITSFTVFIAMLILFIFGGPIIRGFAFAMLIGVVIGTYSSIFVATPIALDFQKKSELEATTF